MIEIERKDRAKSSIQHYICNFKLAIASQTSRNNLSLQKLIVMSVEFSSPYLLGATILYC